MNNLNFDTGIVTLTVNGKAEITFNPTSVDCAGEFQRLYDDLLSGAIDTNFEGLENAEIIEKAKILDREIKDRINLIFGENADTAIFCGQNCLSVAGENLILENFLEAVKGYFAKASAGKVAKVTQKYVSGKSGRKPKN